MNANIATPAPTMLRQAMGMDELKKRVPSLFATKASAKMGERYTFVPSISVVEALHGMGLVVVDASQRKSQEKDSARHLIRFAREADLVSVKGKTRKVGEVIPEVVWSNSHNGRCAAKLFFGLFRLVCANGLIVADKMFAGVNRRHMGDLSGIMDEVAAQLGHTKEVFSRIGDMQKTKLSDTARTQFALKALELRYADDTGKVVAPITAQDLLVPRRIDDQGTDLWHTFNVVQENLMRGGLEGKSAAGRLVRTREVHDVRKVLSFNADLWSLAAERIAA